MNEGTAIGCQLAKSDSLQESFEQAMSVWIIEQTVLLNVLNALPTKNGNKMMEGAVSSKRAGKAD